MSTRTHRPRDLTELLSRISAQLVEDGAQAVVLAGSYAREEATDLSDVDLYAIGDGPRYRLRALNGVLLSVSWRTRAEERAALRRPDSVGGVVPGWRRARILHDPAGVAATLQAAARAFDWSTIATECDAWVADQITGYAEEVLKLVAARRSGDPELASIQRSVLALRLPVVMAVQHRVLYDSENHLWRMVSEAGGEQWAAVHAGALRLGDGRTADDADRSALALYALAVESIAHLLSDEQQAVVDVALRAYSDDSSHEVDPWGQQIGSAPPDRSAQSTLLLMKGPPGSGKSTIARELGRRLRWPVIDKDVFRDLLPDHLGGLSYEAMLDLAERQLAIGLSVIADSPLGYGTGYRKALAIAERTGANLAVVECECSDPAEWRRRIEARAGSGLASHHATDWTKVEAFHERSAQDPYDVEVPSIKIDTVAPVERSLGQVTDWLDSQASSGRMAR